MVWVSSILNRDGAPGQDEISGLRPASGEWWPGSFHNIREKVVDKEYVTGYISRNLQRPY